MSTYNVYDDICTVKGIGKIKVEQFNKKKVFTVGDLLQYYPRDYRIFEKPVESFDVALEEDKPLIAIINGREQIERKSGKLVMKVLCKDAAGNSFMATWFNFVTNPFGFTVGSILVLIGKCSKAYGYNFITHPEVYRISDYEELIGTPVPKYSQSSKLTAYTIKSAINEIITNTDVSNTLPSQIIQKRNVPDMAHLYYRIHHPKDEKELLVTNKYLAYEELFSFLYKLKKNNIESSTISNPYDFQNKKNSLEIINSLPFALTRGQKDALNNIYTDLNSSYLTTRLIQGDVGCGKTMVSILTLVHAYENGYQSVLIVPTEVLASQHYAELCKVTANANINVNVALVTGKTTKQEKRELQKKLVNREPMILIGTHAINNMTDDFTTLAVLVIDEQHKFGVEQRDALKQKHNLHVISLTATPIPRTLSLALYGQGSVSEIRELPANRKPIKNYKTSNKHFDDVFRLINGEIQKGRQAFVVCPAIDDCEIDGIYEVNTMVEMIKKAYPNLIVCGVHGKTETNAREDCMKSYKDGNIDVLVSTTVIEVGINVPNATLMVVINAERFGLATLHQLRGRVGRGSEQAYCIFVDCLQSEKSQTRMKIITSTNSGFEISEADLRERGAGELLGTKQSGDWNFKKANIYNLGLVNLVTKDINEYFKEQL